MEIRITLFQEIMSTAGGIERSRLHERFSTVASRIESIHLKIDAKKTETIDVAISELGLVIKDLEELQRYQAVLPGGASKDDARRVQEDVRKSIGNEISELLNQSKGLQQQLQNISNRINGNNRTPTVQEEERLLGREELAKLLLLVSKAYSIQIIKPAQRNLLKEEIILRKPYLRSLLLAKNDIKEVLAALGKFPIMTRQSS